MPSSELLQIGRAPAAYTPSVLSPEEAAEAVKILKALADPVRLRLVQLIGSHDGGEACVCDLTGEFDLRQPTISHHLRVLREAGVIASERRRSWVYYRVLPAALDRVGALLADSALRSRSRSSEGRDCPEA